MINDFVNIKKDAFSYVVLGNDENKRLTREEWLKLIKQQKFGGVSPNEYIKIELSINSGLIPSDLRSQIWKYLSKCENLALNHNRNLYASLLKVTNEKIENQILKDINRSFPKENVNFFSNSPEDIESMKKKMFNILKAYAIYDSKVGYAQGLNFITLMILRTINVEIDSFWLLTEIMIGKNWREVMMFSTPKLFEILNKFIIQLKAKERDIYNHFANKDV